MMERFCAKQGCASEDIRRGNIYCETHQLKRRYIYYETYEEVIAWAKKMDVRSPNSKENFPYYLKKYIERLKQ